MSPDTHRLCVCVCLSRANFWFSNKYIVFWVRGCVVNLIHLLFFLRDHCRHIISVLKKRLCFQLERHAFIQFSTNHFPFICTLCMSTCKGKRNDNNNISNFLYFINLSALRKQRLQWHSSSPRSLHTFRRIHSEYPYLTSDVPNEKSRRNVKMSTSSHSPDYDNDKIKPTYHPTLFHFY
jgi:hypothetical protein